MIIICVCPFNFMELFYMQMITMSYIAVFALLFSNSKGGEEEALFTKSMITERQECGLYAVPEN